MSDEFHPAADRFPTVVGLVLVGASAVCWGFYLFVHHPLHWLGEEFHPETAWFGGVFLLITGLKVMAGADGHSTTDREDRGDEEEFPIINPATGAPMKGGLDSMGYGFGHGPNEDDRYRHPH
jgi:hypothetical protein